MGADFEDVVRRIVDQTMTRQPQPRVATVTAYDPNRHAIKAKHQPEGHETGWVPIGTMHIGNGIGMAIGPAVGDQVILGFLEGDIETPFVMGRVHSDQERPPVAQSGEVVIQTSNSLIKIDKSGNVTLTCGAGLTVSAQGDIALSSSGKLTHNGHDIGSDHLHTNVVPGGGLSGPPQ